MGRRQDICSLEHQAESLNVILRAVVKIFKQGSYMMWCTVLKHWLSIQNGLVKGQRGDRAPSKLNGCICPSDRGKDWVWEMRERKESWARCFVCGTSLYLRFRVSYLVFILPGTPRVLPIYDQLLMLFFFWLWLLQSSQPNITEHEKGKKKKKKSD